MSGELESSPCVLVVDDNEQNRALAQATLAHDGYEVVLASGGEEGLRAFAQRTPTCVLRDVRMPGMDGFETAHGGRIYLEDGAAGAAFCIRLPNER